LSKLQQPKSKLGQLKQLHSNLGRIRIFLKLGKGSATAHNLRPSVVKFVAVHM